METTNRAGTTTNPPGAEMDVNVDASVESLDVYKQIRAREHMQTQRQAMIVSKARAIQTKCADGYERRGYHFLNFDPNAPPTGKVG